MPDGKHFISILLGGVCGITMVFVLNGLSLSLSVTVGTLIGVVAGIGVTNYLERHF